MLNELRGKSHKYMNLVGGGQLLTDAQVRREAIRQPCITSLVKENKAGDWWLTNARTRGGETVHQVLDSEAIAGLSTSVLQARAAILDIQSNHSGSPQTSRAEITAEMFGLKNASTAEQVQALVTSFIRLLKEIVDLRAAHPTLVILAPPDSEATVREFRLHLSDTRVGVAVKLIANHIDFHADSGTLTWTALQTFIIHACTRRIVPIGEGTQQPVHHVATVAAVPPPPPPPAAVSVPEMMEVFSATLGQVVQQIVPQVMHQAVMAARAMPNYGGFEGAGRGGYGFPQGGRQQQQRICWEWEDTGCCRRGDSCMFAYSHTAENRPLELGGQSAKRVRFDAPPGGGGRAGQN